MSLIAQHWALNIRGCTVAEHAVLLRLADRQNEKNGRCFPGRRSLCFELECSPRYIVEVLQSLEQKRFITRHFRRDAISRSQTTNQFTLNTTRWFPFHSDAVESEEKRLLGFFRRAVESPELAQGFLSAWIEKPKLINAPNHFKRAGLTVRKPCGAKLWLALASESHENHLILHLSEILAAISNDTHHDYSFDRLRIWLKQASPSDFE